MEEAARLELDALAITDHHGFYGAVRFGEAARALGVPSVFGAENNPQRHHFAHRLRGSRWQASGDSRQKPEGLRTTRRVVVRSGADGRGEVPSTHLLRHRRRGRSGKSARKLGCADGVSQGAGASIA
ncbi:MAG: PHP domain-containing protein [Microthrixaceae bacterium]